MIDNTAPKSRLVSVDLQPTSGLAEEAVRSFTYEPMYSSFTWRYSAQLNLTVGALDVSASELCRMGIHSSICPCI